MTDFFVYVAALLNTLKYYADTLGGALVSEGFATYFEELKTGWTAPWAKLTVNEEIFKVALEQWEDKGYNHSDWFFDGPHGKWVGYSIGYQIVKAVFKDGFSIEDSVMLSSQEVKRSYT